MRNSVEQSFEIRGTVLCLNPTGTSPREVRFRWPIAQVLGFTGCYVVRTDPKPGTCDNRNVCAIDLSGKQIWIVAEHRHVYEDSPYTNIANEDGKLKLSNWDGLDVVVNPGSWEEVSVEHGR